MPTSEAIPERLQSLGIAVHRLSVPPTGSIQKRAAALAEGIRSIDADRVNIIAHSMGGLDARFAISLLGLHDRVAILVTVGTPHLGTPVADRLMGANGELGGIGRFLERIGINALAELTTENMALFNRKVKNVDGVRYGCVVTRATKGKRLPLLLRRPHAQLQAMGLENDGLVSVASQRWGICILETEADHWGQIGWSRGVDAPHLYERIARVLRDWGG